MLSPYATSIVAFTLCTVETPFPEIFAAFRTE